jgi:hypothetical protein
MCAFFNGHGDTIEADFDEMQCTLGSDIRATGEV